MRVVKGYFTPTRIEADQAVFVTDDHNVADFAVYPVQSIDAEMRLFRVDSRHLADCTVVMTGDSQNAYLDYSGGYYNAGGSTYGDSSTPSSPAPTTTAYRPPSDASMAYAGTPRSGCLGSLIGIGISMVGGFVLLPVGVILLLFAPGYGVLVLIAAAVLWFFGQWLSGTM